MVVGLFIGMAVVVVILFTVTYVELVRIWRDIDDIRREIRHISEFTGLNRARKSVGRSDFGG